jgi:WD40 repeat protein
MDSARHVIGYHLTQETKVQNACDDVVSAIHPSLPDGARIAFASDDATVRVYDVATGREMVKLTGQRLVDCLPRHRMPFNS